jgi:gingipain K
MKKFGLLTAAFLMIGLLFGTQAMAQHIELGVAKSAQSCANVTDEGFTASFSFGSIDATEVTTEKGVFSDITMEGTYPSGNVGDPSLPAAHQLISVPYGAKIASLEIKSYSTTTYSLADYNIKTVMPLQPSVCKNQKPEDIKFVYNEKAYAAKSFNERPIATMEIEGTMRGIQVGSLTINPVQYNPSTNSIRVFNNIEIEVRYDNYDKSAAYNEFARTFSPYFATVYKAMFNWRDDVYQQHPDLWQTPVKMLVIADRMFEECMQDWIAWKTMKGFYLDVNYTDQIGTTASAIRSFIQGKYAEDAPTFVIIFGDKNQVAASGTGSETHCVTDLQYMSVDNDDFPDIYHSRMCAENVQQMTNIITKTLWYEKLQFETPTRDISYLGNVLLIAGWDGSWNPRVGKPTIQYAMEYYYNAEHGFNNVYNWLQQPYTGCYAPLNTGVGFVNYTAHGGNDCWADPQFSVSNVNGLTNEGMPFLAMGNCCEAADWGINGTCFGEAMIRNNMAAAFAYIGSCPSTYWWEDYYFGVGATNVTNRMPTYEETAYGCYDAIWNDDEYNCVSAIPVIGNLAVCYSHANGYQGSVSDKYYWQSYHALGDGSVMPFRVIPTPNSVSHMAIFPIGMPTYEVSAAPGSYVAISKDGVLHGVGLVDESGVIEVEVDPVTSSGNVTICVTGLDKIPYITTIPAAALEGPYVSVDSYTPANVHVGDESSMSITFKNVGTSATNGTTTVTLSCNDENLTIINGTGSFESLNPETTVQVGGFRYSIAEGVADGTRFTINTTAVCGNDTWEGRTVITAGEAVLEFNGLTVPGGFVPGETLSITALFKNIGHYKATNAIAHIASTSDYVSFENDTFEIGTLDPTGIATCVFNVTIDADCPMTEQLPLTFTLNADGGLIAEGTGVIKNACNVVFELTDSYGDGWNGNYLNVSFSDGTPTQNLTIQDGASANYVIEIGNGVHVTLSWTMGQWPTECSFVVHYEDGDEICQASSPNGVYSFEFDCNCAVGAPVGNFDPVEELQAESTNTSVTLTWNAPEGAINYIISRNGIEIAQTTETTFTDNSINRDGFYTYCVVAEYAEGTAVPDCVIIEFLDAISENEAEFAVYPNPVNNTLFVNCDNTEFSYEMFNGMGQKVASGNATGNAQINVNDMTKGIYFLRLTTGTQVRMEKVVVE